jgi:hypothetical protein
MVPGVEQELGQKLIAVRQRPGLFLHGRASGVVRLKGHRIS